MRDDDWARILRAKWNLVAATCVPCKVWRLTIWCVRHGQDSNC